MGMIYKLLAVLLVALWADASLAACAVTNNFTTGLTAVADDVDQNFTDLRTCIETLQAIDPIISTEIDTSAELRGILTDESGTGALLFAGGALGTPASGVATNLTGTAASLTAGLATALAANGSNCSAGSYPLGVDASGAIESCTDATTEIQSEVNAKSAATSTDNAIARFDSTSGDVQNSGVVIDDSNNVDIPGDVTFGSGGTTDPTYLMFRDTDDAGYTECGALNGTFSCATDADGVIDGTL